MGRRRASTSQLEVKHGNFSAIKSPNRSRAASPAASPRASPSPTASPNRRLSEGSQVKDVGLMREAYSKARNMLLAKRASREEAEDEGHEGHEEHEDGGFKRVGKALVTGMSHALFNRRGSNKNQGLMKSLMAAISKEKILSRISELDLDEQVSDMLGEMYQGMIELLIDNYEPLEGALGELLDEAVTGSQDLEPFIDNLRDAVTGSLVAMLSKQEPLGVGITRPQEILLDRVVEAAQGMASEISYTMRMRGGNKKRNSAPSTSQNLGDGGTGSSRFHSSAGLGFGSSSSGHSTRVTRVAGVNSASASAFGANHGGEAAHHFKKTVRNMFAMNAMGGSGPHFHTERRAEERKHHQPGGHGSEDAEGWEEEGLHSTNLGQTSQALSPQKEAAEAEAMDATNVSQTQDLGDGPHVPAGSTQVTFQSLSTFSRGSSGSGQRPNTVAVEQSSEGVSSRSPSSRKSFAQSYGMQPSSPSSGSGFSSPSNSMSITSPMSSKARADATRSLNPFGFLDTATDEALSKETPQSGEGRAGASGIQHATTDETSKGLERLLVDSDQALPEVAGMQWRPETWQKLRERLFCPQVLESPQLNQRESMEVCRKKAKRERGNVCEDEKPPLHFGASHGPMSDAQLESVMTLRQKAADESPTKRSSLAHQQALKGWTSDHLREHLSDRAVQRLDALKRRAQEEMSVDRYEELAVRAEELMANQMDQLYADGGWEPGKTPPELLCNLGDLGDDPFSLKEASLHPDLSFDSENKDLSIKRTQSVRSLRDSTVAVRRERERREAELAERRRRDELLEKYLAAQLPETFSQHTFDTSLVSPALDRLAPSDSARRLLPPLKTLKQKVKMKTPKALEVTSTDKGAACAQTQPRADRSGPNQGRQGSKSSVGSLNMGQREGVRSNQLIRSQSGSKVMLSMEPTNLKEEVVVSRLQQHMEAFREASFDNVKKDTDILTGQRRQRLDAAALDRDERAFIEKMEAMVGSKSTPAIRHLRPVLKKTGSMPKLLGQRQPRNTKDQYHKPKLAGQPTAVLEQVSRAMAQQARAETMQVEVQKVTWNQLTAVNLLGP